MAKQITDFLPALSEARGLTLLAVTGGIASGKSTVCRKLEKAGLQIFYCDDEAKRIIRTHPQVREELRALVGPGVYAEDGTLVKSVLASYICRGNDCAERVNAIVHPRVAEAWTQRVAALTAALQTESCNEKPAAGGGLRVPVNGTPASGNENPAPANVRLPLRVTTEDLCALPPSTTLVMECALLFESGFDKLVAQSVLIHVSAATQLQRLMQRDGISEEKAREWIALQMSEEEKLQRATSVLPND